MEYYYRLEEDERNTDNSMLTVWYKAMLLNMLVLNESAGGNLGELFLDIF